MKLGTLNLENMYVLAPIMSITVLKGSLETIALLIFLRHDNYITSRKIREKFKNTSSGTLYMRLKKLIYQGLLLKLIKKGDFAGDDRTEYKLSEKSLKVRESLIDYNKEEMSDLIVDLTFNKLNEVIEKILAEIIIIEDFKEYKNKFAIYDFIIYSIKIRKTATEKIEIFSKMIETIISQNNHYRVERLQESIPQFLDMDLLKKHCINNNLIPKFIKLLCESGSFQIAGINAGIISQLSSGLIKSNMDEIIECILNNNQISESSKANRLLERLFVERQDIFDFKYNSELDKLGMGIPGWMIL